MRAPVSLPNPHFTLLCLWIGKNYRLQDIQLSKNTPKTRRPFGSPAALQPPAKFMVENTGLEPVTSWLQTRRSPS